MFPERFPKGMKMDNKKSYISNDVWIGVVLAVLGGVFLYQALYFPTLSSYFPSTMLGALLVAGLGVLGLGIWKTVQVRTGKGNFPNPVMPLRSFLVFLSVVAYVFLVEQIGFFVATTIYLPIGMLLFGQRSAKVIAITTVLSVGLLYYVFVTRLHMHMPQGLFF